MGNARFPAAAMARRLSKIADDLYYWGAIYEVGHYWTADADAQERRLDRAAILQDAAHQVQYAADALRRVPRLS